MQARDVKARVLSNRPVGPATYRMAVECADPARRAQPGQFVMIRVTDRADPLLRRPFSVHGRGGPGSEPTQVEILYRIVGKATRLLSGLVPGCGVDVLGPLGTGFTIAQEPCTVCVVAGGIGVAPMVFLVEELMQRGMAPDRCLVFLGARSKEDLLCVDRFMRLGVTLRGSTEDGSWGHRGLVTAPLEKTLREGRVQTVFACGPQPMLRAAAALAHRHHAACQVCVEAVMACGVGACLGCAVQARNGGYLHACTEGPVFDAADLWAQ